MLLRARLLLPVSAPPIEDGALVLHANRIAAIGPWNELRKARSHPVTDLGDALLLPGLINAHCHLDYTHMAGLIPRPKSFTDWIRAIVPLKASWSYTEFADSWLRGARMLLRSGVTTVADIEAVPELIPDMWDATPLRVHSYRELLGLKNGDESRRTVESAVEEWRGVTHPRCRVGLSPHAPYSTSEALLQAAARAAREHRMPLTTHVAESEQEQEMFLYRHGAMFDWLKSQRDMNDCGQGSSIAHLERCGYLQDNLLAVHVNYLQRNDAATLGTRRVSVVHCPRSHAYFGHLRFPDQELTAHRVNLCLGTDSLASIVKTANTNPELNLFTEMQAFARTAPHLSPLTILRMGTVNPAHALGYGTQLGQLRSGALADLIALPFNGPAARATEAALHHSGPVAASMIDGQWAIPPGF